MAEDWTTVGPWCRYNAQARAAKYSPRPDGQVLVTLWGGRKLLVGTAPVFELEYEDGFDGTYLRAIDVLDVCPDRPWLFEAWYPKAEELHTYAFFKVVALKEIGAGASIDGQEMCRRMGGQYRP